MDSTVAILNVFFRWLHITTACIAVGGVFFARIVLPVALKAGSDSAAATAIFLRARRVFKIVIHACITLLLISGAYNAVGNWRAYTAMGPGVGHGLFGLHLLLALVAFGIALWLLAGREPRANHLRWLAINLGVLLLTIAAASVLKYGREHAARPVPRQPGVIVTGVAVASPSLPAAG